LIAKKNCGSVNTGKGLKDELQVLFVLYAGWLVNFY
jgi:hypothetical protein